MSQGAYSLLRKMHYTLNDYIFYFKTYRTFYNNYKHQYEWRSIYEIKYVYENVVFLEALDIKVKNRESVLLPLCCVTLAVRNNLTLVSFTAKWG